MYISHHLTTNSIQPSTTGRYKAQTLAKRRFCPSMFCFTDEIIVRRISDKAAVWLLTDEREEHSWLVMGDAPACPHCGTTLR